MPTKNIVWKREVTEWYCYHCMEKILAPLGKKETPEEKMVREEKNKKNTLIAVKVSENGKKVTETGYPYFYEKKPHHRACLLAYLRQQFPNDQEKVNKLFKEAEENHNKHVIGERKKGKLSSEEMEKAKSTRKGRENLVNYFMGHYGVSVLSKKVQTNIKDLDEGKSEQFNKITIHYDELLDMFLYYEDDLMGIYKSKIKKGQDFANANQRILYDISVVVLNIDDYKSRKQAKYIQQDQKTDEDLIDVRKYILTNNQNNTETEIDKEKQMIKGFVEEMTKDDDDEYIANILPEGIFDD